MRILNVTGGISANGREQTVHRLNYYFAGCELTCGIFDSTDQAFKRIAKDNNIKTIFYGSSVAKRFNSFSLLPGAGYPRAIRNVIKNPNQFDLIHVYGGPLFHGPIGAMYAFFSRSPLITRFNGYVPLPDSRLKRVLVRMVISGMLQSTRVVFNSHAQKSDVLSLYNVDDGNHINVIPPGVDSQWFEPAENTNKRTALGISPETKIIGSVITPRPVKRLDRAFEIVSSVAETRDIAYIILGDSKHIEEYKQLAEDKGVADLIYWVGHKEQKELAEWYSLFDVTILTSEWESFGMSITESYLCGTPCVAFDVGGMSDQIVDSETGYLIEPYDLNRFSAAVDELLTNETQAEEFGTQGMDYVGEQFTLETVSDQYREMIASIT